jgi:serine-type D-Ala-D-Ala carboxypeptidase (penicillin-binding protein 5/6)
LRLWGRHGTGLMKRLFVALLLLCAQPSLSGSNAQELFATKAKQAFLMDADTGTILFEKEADTPVPPASLAKLMTMELVFHSIRTGEHSLSDVIHISENAWRTGGSGSGGSTMFAKLDSDISLDDLIHAIIIQSANDACIAIAEAFSGNEEVFAKAMNERAKAIGLVKSEFRNSTGLPADGQHVTMRDLANLARHIWKEYPEYYPIYGQREFEWNKIKQRNRNPLLAMDIGADGMKTGFTEETGYAIVGSSMRNGRRLFMALSGMATERERGEEGRKMLEWGMRAFEKRDLFKEGEPVGEASVFGGAKSSVPLVAKGAMSIFVPVVNRDQLKARIVYQGPLVAPIEQGAEVGKLRVFIGERLMQESPLYAGEAVGTGSLRRRAEDALYELMTGWFRTL